MCTLFFFNATGPISRSHCDSTNNFFSYATNKPGANIETKRITSNFPVGGRYPYERFRAKSNRMLPYGSVMRCGVNLGRCVCNVGLVLKTSVRRREQRVYTVWKERKIAGEFAALLYYLIGDGLEFKECYRMS
jgi:hypothetical protein